METLLSISVIGISATATMDLWEVLRLQLLGVSFPNYGFLGRWIGHMIYGRFYHDSIAAASAIKREVLIGWVLHYFIGISFSALLVGVFGKGWIAAPTLGPAILIGVVTVAAPLLLMQPAMGAGLASSKTKNPKAARLHTLVNHVVFGCGLYVTAWALGTYCC